jgi:hypothetical protein
VEDFLRAYQDYRDSGDLSFSGPEKLVAYLDDRFTDTKARAGNVSLAELAEQVFVS